MSKNLWALRTEDGRLMRDGFETKDEAKRARHHFWRSVDDARLHEPLFVTPGPDHKRFDAPPPQQFKRKERRW